MKYITQPRTSPLTPESLSALRDAATPRDLLLAPGEEPAEAPLLPLSLRRPVLERAAVAALVPVLNAPVAKDPQEHHVGEAAHQADAQDTNHDEVALPELVGARSGVLGPSGVQSVGGDDAAEVAQARDEGGGGGDADLSVAALEDLVGPGHAGGDRGAEAEAHHQEAAVPGPVVLESKGGCEEAGDLNADGEGEDEGAAGVKAVGDGGEDENGNQVHLYW